MYTIWYNMPIMIVCSKHHYIVAIITAILWYIHRLVALSATKYVIMTDVTARLNLGSPAAIVLEAFLQVCNNDINLSPAVALARSSIHQPTISLDTMDLVCHGSSTVNPDAFTPYNCLCTLHLIISTFVLTIRSLHLQVCVYIIVSLLEYHDSIFRVTWWCNHVL